MEANLRFAGLETMETKIFGRLRSAWQNWIFIRAQLDGRESGRASLLLCAERHPPRVRPAQPHLDPA
jgi:hypothetical protein